MSFSINVARGKEHKLALPLRLALPSIFARTGWCNWCSQQRGYPGDSASGVHTGDAPPGVLDEEVLRAAVHGFPACNRWAYWITGANPAKPEANTDDAAGCSHRGIGADRASPQRLLISTWIFLPRTLLCIFSSAHNPSS